MATIVNESLKKLILADLKKFNIEIITAYSGREECLALAGREEEELQEFLTSVTFGVDTLSKEDLEQWQAMLAPRFEELRAFIDKPKEDSVRIVVYFPGFRLFSRKER